MLPTRNAIKAANLAEHHPTLERRERGGQAARREEKSKPLLSLAANHRRLLGKGRLEKALD
jgi:hypothetical protein